MRTLMTMANLAAAKARIAESLGLAQDELLRQELESLLRQRKREVMRQRPGILARHSAETVQDLEFKITQGAVAEHPAWEDFITIENLDSRQREFDGYLGELQDLVSI